MSNLKILKLKEYRLKLQLVETILLILLIVFVIWFFIKNRLQLNLDIIIGGLG